MQAIVYEKYGSPEVLELREIEKPTPTENEVLVKVEATAIGAGDWHLMRGRPFLVRLMYGFSKPKFPILGSDFAGSIEAVGSNITDYEVGDEVFGDLSEAGFGAFAQYVTAPVEAIAHKPANLSFAEAAAIPVSSVTALQGLRDKGHIQPGHKVLVNGASGGVGTYAVQIAKALGAEVTAVASTKKLELVRQIGADHVIDYRQEDVTQNGEHYDVIIDLAAYRSILDYRQSLAPSGTYVMVGGPVGRMFQAMIVGGIASALDNKKMGNLLVNPNQADLTFVRDLAAEEKVKPIIDRSFTLDELPEAIRYVEAGRAQGKVVIEVA